MGALYVRLSPVSGSVALNVYENSESSKLAVAGVDVITGASLASATEIENSLAIAFQPGSLETKRTL